MATTQTKPLTASELRKLQERAVKAQHTAQDLDDSRFIAETEAQASHDVALLKDRLSSAMEDASHIVVSDLKDRFTSAVQDLAKAKQDEAAALDLKNHALVIMSRSAFQASIHPDIVGSGKQNISKAGEALGMPYSTIRPYVLAGGALFQQERAFLFSEPDAEDARIVNGSFDDNSRKAQIEKRERAAAKAKAQAELVAKQQAEIEALKQAQAPASDPAGLGQAPAGDQQAPAQDDQQAPAAGDQQAQAPDTDIRDRIGAEMDAALAPAQQAPAAGKSVSDDIADAAKQLVKMCKAQRSNDKAAWQKSHAQVTAILSELFPALKS